MMQSKSEGEELGKLTEDSRDETGLKVGSAEPGLMSFERSVTPAEQPAGAPAAKSRRKKPAQVVFEDEDRLVLPRSALVAMRVSGGLRFSSREIVVHSNGRVRYRRSEAGAPARFRTVRAISKAQVARLRQMIEDIDFTQAITAGGRQSPDALAYEVAARVRRTSRYTEAFEGRVPDALAPLIRQLNQWMPGSD
ncbi:MAG: hypothetical protein ACRDGG_01825 [Anaerolineae bacterium]